MAFIFHDDYHVLICDYPHPTCDCDLQIPKYVASRSKLFFFNTLSNTTENVTSKQDVVASFHDIQVCDQWLDTVLPHDNSFSPSNPMLPSHIPVCDCYTLTFSISIQFQSSTLFI